MSIQKSAVSLLSDRKSSKIFERCSYFLGGWQFTTSRPITEFVRGRLDSSLQNKTYPGSSLSTNVKSTGNVWNIAINCSAAGNQWEIQWFGSWERLLSLAVQRILQTQVRGNTSCGFLGLFGKPN